MAEAAPCFCRQCGLKLENVDRFCPKCGEKKELSNLKKATTLSLDHFKEKKSTERTSYFKKKSSTGPSSSSRKEIEQQNRSVNINVGVMKRDIKNGCLKPVRGKKLPLKVCTNITYERLKCLSIEKQSNHDQMFCPLESYVLLYPDGKDAYFLPVATTTAFQLDLYKEELGKPYSQISMFLCTLGEFEEENTGRASSSLVDPKFGNIFDDEMPNNDLFDFNTGLIDDDMLNSSSINPLINPPHISSGITPHPINSTINTFPINSTINPHPINSTINLSANYPPPDDQENLPVNKKSMAEKLEEIHRCLTDTKDRTEIQIRRRQIWNDANVKFKRNLSKGLEHFQVKFIGEPALDAGGPAREFFTLVFEDAQKYIMQAGADSFTLLHDIKKLRNGDFYRFGVLVALSLIYGCPGPRSFNIVLANDILGLPSVQGKIQDIPDVDIQSKLSNIMDCTNEDELKKLLENFPERYDLGVTKSSLYMSDKNDLVESVIYHSVISSCLEEIHEFKRGLNTLGVLDIMKDHATESFQELSVAGKETSLNDLINLFSTIYYTENNEDKKKLEEDIIFNFTNFIEAIYNKESNLVEVIEIDIELNDVSTTKKLINSEDFIMFCTGSKYITTNIQTCGTIEFCHFDDNERKNHGTRVSMNTCNITLSFPVTKRYTSSPNIFIENLTDDIFNSPGFGKC